MLNQYKTLQMKTNIIQGDIIKLSKKGYFDVIVNPCNCQHNMGAGLALQIATQFPEAKQADDNFVNPSMGDFSWAKILSLDLTVYNLYSQFWYGKPYGHRYALDSQIYNFDTQKNRYRAIKRGLNKINKLCAGKMVGVPKIGCGLAGGNWNVVMPIIEEELSDCLLTIVLK